MHAQLAGLGLNEIIVILLVALVPAAVVAFLVIGIVRSVVVRRPSQPPTWPLAEGASPFQVHQAAVARLQALGVTPWGIKVDRPARKVTVELTQPASAQLDDKIRKTLAPLDVDVVLFEGSFDQLSRSPEGEPPADSTPGSGKAG